jgi:hypothetical protein
MKVRELLIQNEAIKGWKNAGRDLAASRKIKSEASNEYKLVRVNKNGTESKMYDGTKTFRTEDEARSYVTNLIKLNPGTVFKFNLYKPTGDTEQLP